MVSESLPTPDLPGLQVHSRDLDADLMRNIVSLRASQDLFDDLHEGDPALAALATAAEMRVKDTSPPGVISRGFHYSTAIAYPFEQDPALHSRYGDGRYPVWYGSLALRTTVHETGYHMWRIERGVAGSHGEIVRERAVYRVHCRALLVDLSTQSAPALVAEDYRVCQQLGARLQGEGHPGLLAPSARHVGGVNAVLFRQRVLSQPRLHCYLRYRLAVDSGELRVERQPGRTWLKLDLTTLVQN